uniref:Eukaryotic translation initiation factor 5 n=1 Tax=Nannospalax galili TaxID=1026970 RepID=A0A8C6WCY7_NANGA
MSVNVNRSMSDQFYSYKMPCLIAKVEGKRNGIKTVILNMVDVAKLGAHTQFDVKNGRYIVNGSHEANTRQDMLDGVIKKFALCPECENPETDLHVNPKKQTIGNSCKSSDSGTGKKEREKKIEQARKMAPHPPPPPNGISPPPRAVEDEEEEDWGEDTTEDAQRRRMDEVSDHAKVLTLGDLERAVEERVNILFDFVKTKKEEGRSLLCGSECVVAMHQAQLISNIPQILKEMYNADLLEDEVIISWSEKACEKYVSKELTKEIRVKAEPFIQWLKEAEEETSGGEEEEEKIGVPKVETVKSDKDDDVDIDAI